MSPEFFVAGARREMGSVDRQGCSAALGQPVVVACADPGGLVQAEVCGGRSRVLAVGLVDSEDAGGMDFEFQAVQSPGSGDRRDPAVQDQLGEGDHVGHGQ